MVLECEALHGVVVHALCFAVEFIAHGLVEYAACVDEASVTEVASVVEVQSHECVARLEHCEQYGCVGLCARVWLHVGIFGSEEFLDALDGQCLDDIDHLASAIVATAGISLGIFVGEARPHGLHHLFTHEVLTCYQLDASLLTLVFALNQSKNLVVSFHLCCF